MNYLQNMVLFNIDIKTQDCCPSGPLVATSYIINYLETNKTAMNIEKNQQFLNLDWVIMTNDNVDKENGDT